MIEKPGKKIFPTIKVNNIFHLDEPKIKEINK